MKRATLFLTLMILWATVGTAQGPTKIATPDYSFTHFDHNRLLFPGDSLAMELFFDKLDDLLFTGKGHISIMHLGDSHMQAGVFSQQMRDHLLNLFPGITGGRGLVFPYMKTNTPASYFIDYDGEWEYCRNALPFQTRMGLSGATTTTSDTNACFSIVTREKNPSDITPVFDFNLVKILGYGSLTPLVHFGSNTIEGIYNEEEGSYTFQLPDYTDSLYVDFGHASGTFTVTGVYLDNGMPGITYHGIGTNGARVESYLKCEDLERDLKLVHPDLVIFAVGTNDAMADTFSKEKFISDYNTLIRIVKKVSPDCALLFVSNPDYFKKVSKKKRTANPNGPIAEEAFMELGKKYNGAVWDLFDIMGGFKSMEQWEKAELAQKDRVHFTNQGYSLLGDLLFNALIDKYIEHLNSKNQ